MNSPRALTRSSGPVSHKPTGTPREGAGFPQGSGCWVCGRQQCSDWERDGLHIPGGSAERVQLTVESTAMMGASEGEAGTEKRGKGWWSQLSDTEGLSWTQTGRDSSGNEAWI